jgi:hypothetical protein
MDYVSAFSFDFVGYCIRYGITQLLEQMFTQMSFPIRLRYGLAVVALVTAQYGHAQKVESGDAATTEAVLPAALPTPNIVPEGTTVTGRVTWKTTVPDPEHIRVYQDARFCGENGEIELPSLQVNARTLGVAGVMVHITGITHPPEFTSTSLMQIYSCQFSHCTILPHVQLVPGGARLEIRSADFVSHDIEIMDPTDQPVFEYSLAAQNDRTVWRTQKPGLHTLRCKHHGWEQSYLWVLENPFSTITGSDGMFSIPNVPKGNYTLAAWHPSLQLDAEEKNGRVVGYRPGLPLSASKAIRLVPSRTLSVDLELNSAGN